MSWKQQCTDLILRQDSLGPNCKSIPCSLILSDDRSVQLAKTNDKWNTHIHTKYGTYKRDKESKRGPFLEIPFTFQSAFPLDEQRVKEFYFHSQITIIQHNYPENIILLTAKLKDKVMLKKTKGKRGNYFMATESEKGPKTTYPEDNAAALVKRKAHPLSDSPE